ncbi:MAG: glycosyltransferase family 8 protein [Pseudomonadota bacterium]|nr:glycosyltransferase family 8 protein [Pseudomonadota bacterium]
MSWKPKIKLKPNAIVVCCTPSWLPAAACTLKSCADQGGAEVADFYVIAMGLSEQDKTNFQIFQSHHKFSATIIEGKLPQKLIDNAPKRFSAAAFLRLTLNEILDPTYVRVLYLDSDILALSPIAHIFKMDLGCKYLGAVEDYQSFPSVFGSWKDHARSIGLKPGERYFNSGVLLFDWPQIIKHKMLQACVERIMALPKSGGKLSFPDQDMMNLVFAGEWHRLPTRYNLISIVSDYFPEDPIFRHFTMDHKPWGPVWVLGHQQGRQLYQSMLKGSAWATKMGVPAKRIAPLESLRIFLRRADKATRERYRKHLES